MWNQSAIFLSVTKLWSKLICGQVSPCKCLKKSEEKPLFSLENSGFYGGRYRTRTCDPLHVKRQGKFFLIISAYFYWFLFHFICFSVLSAHRVSTCSTAVCDWLCGQRNQRINPVKYPAHLPKQGISRTDAGPYKFSYSSRPRQFGTLLTKRSCFQMYAVIAVQPAIIVLPF